MLFRKKKNEQSERIQRMLAREQGIQAPAQPSPDAPPRRTAPQKAGRPGGRPAQSAVAEKPRTKRFSALVQKRRRQRRNALIAAVAVLTALIFVATGALGSSIAMLGDVADSIALYLDRNGSWPASTGITDPLRVEELAGGFVELGREDVAVYSAYGSKVRAFQPGYARPALAVGNTRFCVYNRAGNELRVESRTKNLYTKTFAESILLCAMSANGSVAVVTESSRYAAEVTVYDALFRQKYVWNPTQAEGTPVAISFASDNHRFAAGSLSAVEGRLCTTVYLMDTDTETVGASYTATPGSMVLELDWLSSTRLLAVFDTYAAIINPSDGSESARYEYGGATLQSVSTAGKDTALLLSSRTGSTLAILDDTLSERALVTVGQASQVSCTRTAVYVLGENTVDAYSFTGAHRGSQQMESPPLAVLDADETLVFSGTRAEVLQIQADTGQTNGEAGTT